MSGPTPFFQSEVQLAGWSESHTSGCKVTFFLPDSADLDAFRALTVRKGNVAGQRMACVLVLIGDDEQPEEPPEPMPRGAEKAPDAPKGGALAKLAGMWCADPEFREFLSARFRAKCWTVDEAAAIVRRICKVATRAELDHDDMAAALFHGEIREPFMRWKQGVR